MFTLITAHGTAMHTLDGFNTKEVAEDAAKQWADAIRGVHSVYLSQTVIMNYESN